MLRQRDSRPGDQGHLVAQAALDERRVHVPQDVAHVPRVRAVLETVRVELQLNDLDPVFHELEDAVPRGGRGRHPDRDDPVLVGGLDPVPDRERVFRVRDEDERRIRGWLSFPGFAKRDDSL